MHDEDTARGGDENTLCGLSREKSVGSEIALYREIPLGSEIMIDTKSSDGGPILA